VAGLETKHFGKYFRRMVGIGFKEWTTIMRIGIAMDMMRTGHQKLADIALEVGFQDFRRF